MVPPWTVIQTGRYLSKTKSKDKTKRENRLGWGPKLHNSELRSNYVLNLGFKLWPLMNRFAYGCGAGIRVGVFESTFFLFR